MSEGSYNAVTWLLDRNVEEGRANKVAFDDTAARLTYGELQRETRRAAASIAPSRAGRIHPCGWCAARRDASTCAPAASFARWR